MRISASLWHAVACTRTRGDLLLLLAFMDKWLRLGWGIHAARERVSANNALVYWHRFVPVHRGHPSVAIGQRLCAPRAALAYGIMLKIAHKVSHYRVYDLYMLETIMRRASSTYIHSYNVVEFHASALGS